MSFFPMEVNFLYKLQWMGAAEAQQLKPGRYLRFLVTNGGRQTGRAAIDDIWFRRCQRAEMQLQGQHEEFWDLVRNGTCFSADAQELTQGEGSLKASVVGGVLDN